MSLRRGRWKKKKKKKIRLDFWNEAWRQTGIFRRQPDNSPDIPHSGPGPFVFPPLLQVTRSQCWRHRASPIRASPIRASPIRAWVYPSSPSAANPLWCATPHRTALRHRCLLARPTRSQLLLDRRGHITTTHFLLPVSPTTTHCYDCLDLSRFWPLNYPRRESAASSLVLLRTPCGLNCDQADLVEKEWWGDQRNTLQAMRTSFPRGPQGPDLLSLEPHWFPSTHCTTWRLFSLLPHILALSLPLSLSPSLFLTHTHFMWRTCLWPKSKQRNVVVHLMTPDVAVKNNESTQKDREKGITLT